MDPNPEQTELTRSLVQRLYDCGMGGDLDGVVACMSTELTVLEPAMLPYGGTYRGREGFLHLFGRISEYLDLTGLKVDYLVADGDRAFGVLRIPDRTTGGEVLLAEESIVRDGLITDMRIFVHDGQSLQSRN